MNDESCAVEISPSLREQAEAAAGTDEPDLEQMTPGEIRDLIHTLRVDRAELEMKNEILVQTCEESRRSREDAARSEETWRETIERVNCAIIRWRPDGSVLFVNRFLRDIFGYSMEEFTVRGIRSIIPEEARSGHPPDSLLGPLSSPSPVEIEHVTMNGERLTVSWTSHPIVDRNGNTVEIISSGNDITNLRNTERALRDSEERLDAFFRASPVRLGIIDAELRYVKVNDITGRYFGRPSEEIVGMSIREAIPEFAPIIEPVVREVLETGRPRLNHEVTGVFPGRPGESITWFSAYFPVRLSEGKNGVGLIAVDITDRKKIEERLARSEREARSLLENSPDVIVRFDRDLRIQYANPVFEQVTGVSSQSAIGHTFAELGFPEDRVTLWESVIRKVFDSGEEGTLEYEYTGTQGSRAYHARIVPEFINKSIPETSIAISHDVSDLKQVEEALRLSEERYRIISDLVSDYAYSFRVGEKGVFTLEWISGAFERITGYAPQEANSWGDWSRLVHPDDRELNQKRLETLLSGREDATEHRIITKGGEVRWVRDYGRPLLDEQGRIFRTVGATTDITEIKLAEEELRKYQIELEERVWRRTVELEKAIESLRREITERERAEAALTQSERMQLAGAQLAHLGSWEWDIPNNKFTFSDEWKRIHGVTVDAMSKDDLMKIAHPDDVGAVRNAFNNALEYGTTYQLEHRIIRQDTGEERYIKVFGEALRNDEGRPIRLIGAVQDITARKRTEGELAEYREHLEEIVRERTALLEKEISERKQVEEYLRESEKQLSAIFQSVSEGIMIFDMKGKAVLANAAVARITGFSTIEEMRRNLDFFAEVFELFFPDGQEVPREEWPVAKVLRGESVMDMELLGRRRDTGKEWFFSFSGEPVRNERGEQILAVIITRDITERKRAEKAILESEFRFRQLADSMPQLVWTAEPDGRVDYYNERYKIYRGISPTEENVFEWGPALHPDDLAVTETAWRHALQSGGVYQVEHRVRMANGEYRWHLSRGIPARDEQGHVVKWYGTATDIHDTITAQQKLRESEERLRLIVDNSPDTMFYQDRDLRYEWVANQESRFDGIPVSGKTDEDLPISINGQSLVDVKRNVLETGESRRYEFKIRLDGDERWISAVYVPRRDESGNIIGLFGYTRDITERRQAEQAILASEAKFRAVFEQAAIGMGRVSFDDMRWIEVNETFSSMLGYTREEMTQIPWPEMTHPDDIEIDLIPFRRMAAGDLDNYTVEKRFIHKQGHPVWARLTLSLIRNSRNEPDHEIAVIENITERKEAEQALRESEEDLNRAQTVARIGSWRLNTRRNELHWSAETYHIFGVPPDTPLTYESFLNRIHPEDREYVNSRWTAAMQGEPYDIEHRIVVGDTIKWVREKAEMEFDPDGNFSGGFGTVQDITERKESENRIREYAERLRRQTAQLTAANKELEAFSYSVSHDLRAPLRSIDGFSLALVEDFGGTLGEEGNDYLNRIRAAAQRMARLIDDLLQLSRTSRATLTYTTVDLSEQAHAVLEELRSVESDRNVETVIQEGLRAEGDETLLRQVIQNLLGNAWKFTSRREDARIEFGEIREDGKRVFFVRDNGAGFDMKYAENLYTPFRRLHSESEFSGTGIGLSIVKRIILRHGGEIWAESEAGKGATFFFTIGEG